MTTLKDIIHDIIQDYCDYGKIIFSLDHDQTPKEIRYEFEEDIIDEIKLYFLKIIS